jgi:hypothetical protein
LIAAFTTQPKNINSHAVWDESSMRDLELFLSRQKSAAEIFMAATMAFRSFLLFLVLGSMVLITGCERNASSAQKTESRTSARSNLWRVYERSLKKGQVHRSDTHPDTIDPVWKGFAPAKFAPTVNPETRQPYTYNKWTLST